MEGMSGETMNGQELANLMKHNKPQTKEAQRTPSRINTHTNTYSPLPRHIIVKLLKIKATGKIWKTVGKKKTFQSIEKKHITIAALFHTCDLIITNKTTGITNTEHLLHVRNCSKCHKNPVMYIYYLIVQMKKLRYKEVN